MKKDKEVRPWYKIIAELILEIKTFDVTTNTDGLKTVSQMITKKICDDLSWGDVAFNNQAQRYLDYVKKNLPHAIQYLMDDLRIPVYRMVEPRYEVPTENGDTYEKGGKFIEFLTIDETYRDARQADIERIGLAMRKTLVASKHHLGIIAPRKDFETLVAKEMKQLAE